VIINNRGPSLENTSSLPRLILTPGEPAGIGPDLVIKVAQNKIAAHLIVVCDPDLIRQRARQISTRIDLIEYKPDKEPDETGPGQLYFIHQSLQRAVNAGQADVHNAAYVIDSITTAVAGCQSGQFDAMVTGPVSKSVIADAGIDFRGHTEFIAGLCNNAFPVMMLTNGFMRVALVTTHIPLNQVTEYITTERLKQVVTVVNNDLISKFKIENPGILICGINPHAGEQGYLGTEEIDILIPVIEKLKNNGFNLKGPVSADTAFTNASLQEADVIITMYHDQGLPVLKSHGFGDIVNVTLGLPIIRTSVDHGTALALAGTGKASETSMLAAINTAIDMIELSSQAIDTSHT